MEENQISRVHHSQWEQTENPSETHTEVMIRGTIEAAESSPKIIAVAREIQYFSNDPLINNAKKLTF